MIPPPRPLDETQRLAALRGLGILDTPPEAPFDGIVRRAADVFGTPIAGLSFVDQRRQWFKSLIGGSLRETSREISFAGHTILGDAPLVVEDASADPRFADNPMVLESPGIRFYAGQPITAPDGQRVGALSIMDTVPREFGPGQRETLRQLATAAERELARRCHPGEALPSLCAAPRAAPSPAVDDTTLRGIADDDTMHPYYFARLIAAFTEAAPALAAGLSAQARHPDKWLRRTALLAAMARQIGADSLAATCEVTPADLTIHSKTIATATAEAVAALAAFQEQIQPPEG